jgi:hypothetical protein
VSYLVSALLAVAGLIHLLPVSGAAGASQLNALYGLALDDPGLILLLRHRAVLFGLLGVFLLAAAWRSAWQPAAVVAGLVSVVSFLWLYGAADGYNDALRRVAVADLIALACLLAAGAALLWRHARN